MLQLTHYMENLIDVRARVWLKMAKNVNWKRKNREFCYYSLNVLYNYYMNYLQQTYLY